MPNSFGRVQHFKTTLNTLAVGGTYFTTISVNVFSDKIRLSVFSDYAICLLLLMQLLTLRFNYTTDFVFSHLRTILASHYVILVAVVAAAVVAAAVVLVVVVASASEPGRSHSGP